MSLMDSALHETNVIDVDLHHMYMVPAYECPLLLWWWPSVSLLKTRELPQYPPMPPRSILLGWYHREDQLHYLCWLPGPAARPLWTFLRFAHLRQAALVCLLLQLILVRFPFQVSDSAPGGDLIPPDVMITFQFFWQTASLFLCC